MQFISRLTNTISRYLTLIGDQQIIDQRIKELCEIEKEVTIKRAYLGDAEVDDLQVLTHAEQVKLLRALILQKVANNENAEETIAALELIENKPPHTIKHDHLYSIPILSEIGDVLRIATLAGTLIGGALLVILAVNPGFCGERNGSQFCDQTRSVYRYFYNPKGE
ncbi:hypothetical protein [Tolypothrix sp. VBCCA 56010]|uniref:hypothetical protein n=1 Tax=Tolypothrix sp. VBCCA 56010 TaxID=3137731 RepID=UPI003D7C8F8E